MKKSNRHSFSVFFKKNEKSTTSATQATQSGKLKVVKYMKLNV